MTSADLCCLLLLFFTIICRTQSQSTVYVGIVDDNDYPKGILNIAIPNVTVCHRRGLMLQLQWVNSSSSLVDLTDELEVRKNQINVYLARTATLSTKLIQDFCHTYQIPFINIISYESSPITSLRQQYSVIPDILRVLISYLKYHRIQRAVYIYDDEESAHRLYELLKLMNDDAYFNHFSLDIRNIRQQDVYSLLYSIEIYSINKGRPPKYILLDLDSHLDYGRIFDKISHMGLTSDLYYYIILSTFDVCLWMTKSNFTGRLVYFDYQERVCQLDKPQTAQSNDRFPSKPKHASLYYRSTLSFRTDNDQSNLNNATKSTSNGSSPASNSPNDTTTNLNSCYAKAQNNTEYFSYPFFQSQLSKSYQLYSRQLFDSLNLLIHTLTADLIDCKTLRLKQMGTNVPHSNFADASIYTIKDLNVSPRRNKVELIGRYSYAHDEYHQCDVDKNRDFLRMQKIAPTRVYYITSLFDEPFVMLRKRTPLHTKYSQYSADMKELRGLIFDFEQLEGFCVDLAAEVCTRLNITCKFRIVADGGFGSKNASTGIWNGMVGEIVSRKADMAIAPLTISQIRMEVVDFSKPFMNLGISIMIRKPDAQKPGVFSFMNPVSMEIWLCLSLAYFAVSVILFLTSRVVNSGWRRRIVRRPSYRSYSYPKSVNDRRKSEVEITRQPRDSNASEHSSDLTVTPVPLKPTVHRRHRHRARNYQPIPLNDKVKSRKLQEEDLKRNDVHLFGISNALFFSFASFMRQSINLVPKSFSGRVAATSWWYFSLIFISSYTANLVAFLTVEKLVTPIESVEDLAKQQEIKYGSLRNGTTAAFFEKSNVEVFQYMWSVMQRSPTDIFVSTNDEGVAKVRNAKGKYAFFIESTKNEYVNEHLPCDTMKVGSDLDSKGYGIATGLGLDLSEAVNIIVTNLRESGFLDKIKQRWWYENSECSQSAKDKRFSELSLSSVTGLFYIFLFGIILSCFIAFSEFLITAKAESEMLQIDFREILRIKMIENLVGITINAQRQLEFGSIDTACNYNYQDEEDEVIEQYTKYQLQKPQSDV